MNCHFCQVAIDSNITKPATAPASSAGALAHESMAGRFFSCKPLSAGSRRKSMLKKIQLENPQHCREK
jgi:hypothetical protein